MADPTNNSETSVAAARTRSPNYPLVDLGKAIDRVTLLYKDNKQHEVPVVVARTLWGYKKSSAAGNQCVAALKAYGLLKVQGKGESRHVSVTDNARRIILDAPEGKALLKQAALGPAVHDQLWAKFGKSGLPDDAVIRHHLIFDKKFNEDVVEGLIGRFRSTIAFANLDSSDIISDGSDQQNGANGADQEPTVGDHVQWTSQGVGRFQEPKKLVGLSDDGEYAFVEGERGGVLMSELSVVEAPAGAGSGAANRPLNPLFKPPLPSDGVPLSIKTQPGSVEILTIPKMTRAAFEFLKTQLNAFEDEIVADPAVTPQQDENHDES